MDLALIMLVVVLGVGAIVYAGLRKPGTKSRGSGDSGGTWGDSDGDGGGDGGGD
jgi:hypothetical protein